ncbi:MAG: RNA polymerase sigma-70 factor [Bacteroidota bacterium]
MKQQLLTEQQVQDAFLSHPSQANFEAVFRHFYTPLCSYACKYVGEPLLAEEVVSDVLMKVWQKREELAIQTSLKSFLFASTRNRAIDYLRKYQKAHLHRHEIEPQHAVDTICPERQVIASEMHATLQQAINNLPPQGKNIFQMSRDEGLKYREIAEKLDLSIKTVETHMRRSLIALRAAVA